MVERSTAASEARRFFALTLLWAWAFWWLAVFLGVAWPEPAALLLFALGGIGPVLVASVLVHRGDSRERLRDFWLRVVDPRRIPPAWHLAILLVAAGQQDMTALSHDASHPWGRSKNCPTAEGDIPISYPSRDLATSHLPEGYRGDTRQSGLGEGIG
jgi:hypothetical protein